MLPFEPAQRNGQIYLKICIIYLLYLLLRNTTSILKEFVDNAELSKNDFGDTHSYKVIQIKNGLNTK